jgi:hypothetical protein
MFPMKPKAFTYFHLPDCDASPMYKIVFELVFHQIKASSAMVFTNVEDLIWDFTMRFQTKQ